MYNSGTATQEELTAAENKYNEAYEEYQEYVNTAKGKIQTMQTEYLALIPNYTNSWQTTTNTPNNVQLDFKDYTGTAHFILWAKIENGTNTYYDFMPYSSEIKEEQNQPTQEEPTGEEKPSGDWTDFSNVKYELKKDGISGALVEATGVTGRTGSTYDIYISATPAKPDKTSIDAKEKIIFSYDEKEKKFKTSGTSKVARLVELNQDLYINVIEHNNSTGKEEIVSYGKKLERFAEAKYSDAFNATFMTNDADQIVTTFTHEQTNNRKIQIKVGKINNTTILNKLKNQDSSGFADLLSYAKSNSGIYDEILNADINDWFAIEYNAGNYKTTGNKIISLTGLENEAYYYLYIKTDDENGKYISNEAVTLAQASVRDNWWGMFFLWCFRL